MFSCQPAAIRRDKHADFVKQSSCTVFRFYSVLGHVNRFFTASPLILFDLINLDRVFNRA